MNPFSIFLLQASISAEVGGGGGSKELQTKEVQMQHAELTAAHLVLTLANSRPA